MKPADFIATFAPAAVASSKATGIPAAFVVAQGALESAWGSSALTTQARNLFGVKADASWHGDTFSMETGEYVAGKHVMVPAKWRKYPTWIACLDDHARFFLDNPRYAGALAVRHDSEAFAHAVQAAGYATDPAYAEKIIAVIRGHGLASFDQREKT
ncbi:MAG TPA: mannosyl-glycoprotein endo-beta-N-acetylglucosamidase [Oxalobacteraceae bacterium]|nr:mannosyl-glycoprotein endo-beta-N-acetylglucosamidase [Oxalobacteraceae bacterium]